MATKVSYSVALKTLGGTTKTVSGDAGAAVFSALGAQQDLKIKEEGGWTIIPFHAVDSAVVTITNSTVDDPVDATCNETNETEELPTT